MVLSFENKVYENFSQRLKFSLFKYSYVSNKYQFFFKITYIIESLLENFLLIFFLSVNYTDLKNDEIRQYANIFNDKFDKNKFLYTNYDKQMSFYINFFDLITKPGNKIFLLVLILILIFYLIKYSEFIYFMFPKVSVINVKGFKKILYYFYSFQDQLMKTILDIIILAISISTFACSNSINYIYNCKCFTGIHLSYTILSSIILFLSLFYIIIQCIFYDPCNLISDNNFGKSENSFSDFLYVLQKISLVILNLFKFLGKQQEKIKLILFFVLSLMRLRRINNEISKFSNFYQNFMIFQIGAINIFNIIFFIYVMCEKKLNIYSFLLTFFSSILIGYLILNSILLSKTHKLYTREKNLEDYPTMVFLIETIVNYKKKLNKIIVNGFLQCYNIKYEEEKDDYNEIDEVLSLTKNKVPDVSQNEINLRQDSILQNNVKYLMTILNMFIIGSVRELLIKLKKKKNHENKNKNYKQNKLYEFACQIILTHSIKSHEKAFYFKLLTAEIYLRKLNNITKTWFILLNFYESFNKFSLKQQFYIFEKFQELHEQLELEDIHSIHNQQNIKNIIKLDKSNEKFIRKITKCTNLLKQFWMMYLGGKQKGILSIENMNHILKLINRKYSKIQNFFDKIQKLYEDNSFLFYLYCCFLKNIMNNEQLGEHIIKLLLRNIYTNQASRNVSKVNLDFIDDDYYKMTNIEEVGLMIVSCNPQEIGKIKWCNNKISNLLSFSRNDLSKLKINRIIPPVVAARHNEFIRAYIQTNKEYYINLTRANFFINSNDFLIPVLVYINKIPKIKNGIEIFAMVSKVIDNTFLLYKNPEIKIKTKLCFVLINEDGSIESVDKNANTYLGIPNLVRNGWKTKITIDKRKCNLFELSPELKKFLYSTNTTTNDGGNNSNKFLTECEVDTSCLMEEFTNDEYGLFLSINKRINDMANRGVPINKWICNANYYDDSFEGNDEKGNDGNILNNNYNLANNYYSNNNIPISRLREEFKSIIIPNIFKEHHLIQEIYQINSTHNNKGFEGNKLYMKLFIIKYYYPIDSFSIPQIEAEKEKRKSYFLNVSSNVGKSKDNIPIEINNKSKLTGNLSFYDKKKLSNNEITSIIKPIKENSPVRKNKLPKNSLSSIIEGKPQIKVNQENNNEPASNEALSTTKINNSKINLNAEKLRIRKEIIIQENTPKNSAAYKFIQILFLLLILGLLIIIILGIIFRNNFIKFLNTYHNILFLIIYRRDLISNLLMNTFWHIEIANNISQCNNYPEFNLTADKILQIIQYDVLEIKTFQQEILDEENKIELRYHDNPEDKYFIFQNYDANHKLFSHSMTYNSAFDTLISNYDKYLQYNNSDYFLVNKHRILELFNPEFYLNTSTFSLNDFEVRILDIFINGNNIIYSNENEVIQSLVSQIKNRTKKEVLKILIICIAAIVYTIILSALIFSKYTKAFALDDKIFDFFVLIDFNCGIKESVICDKFLKILNKLKVDINSNGLHKLKEFYSLDQSKLFNLVCSMMSSKLKKKSLAQTPILVKAQSSVNKEVSNISINRNATNLMNNIKADNTIINGNVNNSEYSISTKLKKQNSNSQSIIMNYSSGRVSKIKNSDEELINKYKRFNEDNRRKRIGFDRKRILDDENGEKQITIVKSKTLLIFTVLVFSLLALFIIAFFICLILMDNKIKSYINNILNILDFYQRRFSYTSNSIISFKNIVLKSSTDLSTDNINTDIQFFEKSYNASIENEEKIQKFIFETALNNFDDLIFDFDNEISICNLLLTKIIGKYRLSNNLTLLNDEICSKTDTLYNMTLILNKPLIGIILYEDFYLRDKFNNFFILNKTKDAILSYLDDNKLEFIQLMTQYVLRQSIFVICNVLKNNFRSRIKSYSTLSIIVFAIFVLTSLILFICENISVLFISKYKKSRNELLTSIIPNEFICQLFEKEEEEKERKRETG